MMVANLGQYQKGWKLDGFLKVPGRVMLMLGAIQARLGGENKW